MEWNWKKYNREKTLFRSYYCVGCKQTKPCRLLTDWDSEWKNYCCWCYYEREKERAKEYNSYERTLASQQKERKEKFQQLELLRSYLGCHDCKSLEVDAYSLYESSKLVCQPCRMKKEGGASSPVSFLERQKWYGKYWKIDLEEWLDKYRCLPVNADCAREWLKDKKHLKSCVCLARETWELVELFTNSLQKNKKRLEKECQCKVSEKVRVSSYDNANYGYTYCEICQERITGAGKMGVIKNRNDPRFWGLEIKEKILCLVCLTNYQEKMPANKKYTLNKYLKRYEKKQDF